MKPPRGVDLQAKPSVTIGGLPRALPKVAWKRHRTPLALLRAFFGGMGIKDPHEIREAPAMLEGIRDMGVWAFVDNPGKKTPVVHYWFSPRANRLHVAYVLGHEVGHISGRKLQSRRNAWREELRADEYGAAAFLAMQHVLGLR